MSISTASSTYVPIVDKSYSNIDSITSTCMGRTTGTARLISSWHWDDNFNGQMIITHGSDPTLQYRTMTDGSNWYDWRTVLTSNNYTTYCATASHTHQYLKCYTYYGNITATTSSAGQWSGTCSYTFDSTATVVLVSTQCGIYNYNLQSITTSNSSGTITIKGYLVDTLNGSMVTSTSASISVGFIYWLYSDTV